MGRPDALRMVAPKARTVVIVSIAVLLGISLIGPARAGAESLPRLLSSDRCVDGCARLAGVYKVRPARVELDDFAGGTLTLRWSRWNRRQAVGSGHGLYIGAGASYRYPVKVRARRPRHGDFTRLYIRKVVDGETQSYTLRLERRGGEVLWDD
jgi:hypothetical protein